MKIKGILLSQTDVTFRIEHNLPMPNGFTGRWGDSYFYLGKQWFGPTNRVGQKKILGRKILLTNPNVVI